MQVIFWSFMDLNFLPIHDFKKIYDFFLSNSLPASFDHKLKNLLSTFSLPASFDQFCKTSKRGSGSIGGCRGSVCISIWSWWWWSDDNNDDGDNNNDDNDDGDDVQIMIMMVNYCAGVEEAKELQAGAARNFVQQETRVKIFLKQILSKI